MKSARIVATREKVDKADLAERSTLLARRIWDAFARHKWTTSNVALPPWNALDEGRRRHITSLSVEALSSGGDDVPRSGKAL